MALYIWLFDLIRLIIKFYNNINNSKCFLDNKMYGSKNCKISQHNIYDITISSFKKKFKPVHRRIIVRKNIFILFLGDTWERFVKSLNLEIKDQIKRTFLWIEIIYDRQTQISHDPFVKQEKIRHNYNTIISKNKARRVISQSRTKIIVTYP